MAAFHEVGHRQVCRRRPAHGLVLFFILLHGAPETSAYTPSASRCERCTTYLTLRNVWAREDFCICSRSSCCTGTGCQQHLPALEPSCRLLALELPALEPSCQHLVVAPLYEFSLVSCRRSYDFVDGLLPFARIHVGEAR
jgi:hypothetical protein